MTTLESVPFQTETAVETSRLRQFGSLAFNKLFDAFDAVCNAAGPSVLAPPPQARPETSQQVQAPTEAA